MPAGRPPKYKTAEEMERAIGAWILYCQANEKPFTVAGLAYALGFNSRQTLLDYENKPEFLDLIKNTKLLIESQVEERLFAGNCTGAIFWLKNHAGYKDAKELTGADGGPIQTQTVNMTAEEYRKSLQLLREEV